MSGDWRGWATTVSLLILAGGVALFVTTGNPVIGIVGAVALVSSIVERTYGQPKLHATPQMQPTDERFVDPETGKLVTVWLDRGTGERRYVADGEGAH